MTKAECIFATGTMRTGGSLLNNIVSLHSEMHLFGERVHFFRFLHNKYDPLTPKNVERMLRHQHIRLHNRFNMDIDWQTILKDVLADEISYKSVLEKHMKWLLNQTGPEKKIWGDYGTLQWREIPTFLAMFPNGKALHCYRDLRGLLASWGRMSFASNHLYLNCIFNWIDSINHILRFRQTLRDDQYMAIRFEDMHARPEEMVRNITDFLGVEFEPQMIDGEMWPELFNTYNTANVSSHTAEHVYGFNTERSEKWRTSLEPWEITLAEYLAHDQLEAMGYELTLNTFDPALLRHGMDLITRDPMMLNNLHILQATGEGSDRFPQDPTDVKSWAIEEGGGFTRFSESPEYQQYLSEMNACEEDVNAKYGG